MATHSLCRDSGFSSYSALAHLPWEEDGCSSFEAENSTTGHTFIRQPPRKDKQRNPPPWAPALAFPQPPPKQSTARDTTNHRWPPLARIRLRIRIARGLKYWPTTQWARTTLLSLSKGCGLRTRNPSLPRTPGLRPLNADNIPPRLTRLSALLILRSVKLLRYEVDASDRHVGLISWQSW